jgi:NitT/TauT family transport system substrate-binding protein
MGDGDPGMATGALYVNAMRVIFALLASIAVLVPLSSDRAQAATKLSIAIVDNDGFQAYIARDLGMFQRAGLDVDIQNLGKGSAVAAAVTGHDVAIGISNIVTIAQAIESGLPFRFIAPASMEFSTIPTTRLVTWPQSAIRSAKDLNGKTLGAQTTSGLIRLVEEAWIDKNGGDSSTVQFIELPPPAILPALERGTIAAATLIEPMLTADLPQIRPLGNPFDALGPRLMVTGWFATNDWIDQNRDVAATFAKVMGDAARWANDPKNRVQVAELQRKYGASSAINPYAVSFDTATLQPILDGALKYKLLARPLSAAEMIFKR